MLSKFTPTRLPAKLFSSPRQIIPFVFVLSMLLPDGAHSALGQTLDPGPRALPADAGGPLPGLTAAQTAYFYAARNRFSEVDSVTGNEVGETGEGLGPRFNGNSCVACHAYPSVGGSSPPVDPQIGIATLDGARNAIPPFLTLQGPVREARFELKPDGTKDGKVHQLFVVTGRYDAPGCEIRQPDFSAELSKNNVRFRIPTPLFGLGLVEAIPDTNLRAAFDAGANLRSSWGIGGHFNTSSNDGTITRFGWKAQNKSLLMFAGEAYNVEIGVSNEIFPNEIESLSSCGLNATPEDTTNLNRSGGSGSAASDYSSDIVNFAAFARLSMPPTPRFLTREAYSGVQVFQAVGCHACHTITQTTASSTTANSISNITFQPFSDFAVHKMGSNLADGISQGSAEGDEFRTAPLWGVGQRSFFLHDGRTADLHQAVVAHASQGSEANNVIEAYRRLPPSAVSALLAFLRSL